MFQLFGRHRRIASGRKIDFFIVLPAKRSEFDFGTGILFRKSCASLIYTSQLS